MPDFNFLIVTSPDLPEAYFLAACLALRTQRFAIVSVARPAAGYLRALGRLRRTRGVLYLVDLLLARLIDFLLVPLYRRRARRGAGAFPEVDASLIRRIRGQHPHLDCTNPHARDVLEFVRAFGPDYILLAGCPVLKETFYGLARRCAFNGHLGVLPDLRGSDCPLRAFALDRPESAGYCIHVVSERVDAGDVVLGRRVDPGDARTLPRYLRRLQREASNGFVEVIDRLLQGAPLPRTPQDRPGRYWPPAGLVTRLRAQRNYARAARSASVTPTPKRP